MERIGEYKVLSIQSGTRDCCYTLALLRAAKAHALLLGRGHVVPEDVQTLFVAVAGHRLVAEAESSSGPALARAILQTVAVD